ncbi:MAG: beta-ketoacyl-ACP synthase III [Candidatus Edwardsbacteria bacterium]
MKGIKIIGTGSAVPSKVLTNFDLEKIVDTSDEWIRTRSGIRERHIADKETAASDLAAQAAQKALEDAGVSSKEVGLIIIGTVTPDMSFPSTSCMVQDRIGAKEAVCFDISAGCTGFIYGLEVARGIINNNPSKIALVIGVEILSKITDYTDRSTCVLFGDGAGAAVLKATEERRGILDTHLGADGSLGYLLYMPGGGSRNPLTHEALDNKMHYLKMAGNEVFKSAVRAMEDSAVKILEKVGWSGKEVSLLIPHQANIRIIEATAKRIGLSMERVFVNIDKYGNTSSASIPIALDEARRQGRIKDGDKIVLVAFGAGFTWGAVAIEW